MAWHDSGWNGNICRDPEGNIYCRDSHSLLSTRIEKRIDLVVEVDKRGKPFFEASDEGYYPPCYWSINASGANSHEVYDPHPFQGLKGRMGEYIQKTPPYEALVQKNSIYTWCFKLGFGAPPENYSPKLEENTRKYLGNIEEGNSLVFLYSNYSNPVNGDENRYLLLGVSRISGTEMPHNFDIPDGDLSKIQSQRNMRYFPKQAWQFRVDLDNEEKVILPYYQFVDWYNQGPDYDKEKRESVLQEVSVSVQKKSLIPHFKYVSMHIGHDKGIFLLYDLLRAVEKMKEHPDVVDYALLESSRVKIEKILDLAWKNRGKYPGIRNLLILFGGKEMTGDTLNSAVGETVSYIDKSAGGQNSFMKSKPELDAENPRIRRLLVQVRNHWEEFRFLSQFDFSVLQFKNIRALIVDLGLEEFQSNPYLIYEKYNYAILDKPDGNVDESDYGINVFQIDMALMPDVAYADWTTDFFPESPQRLRALIAEILTEKAESGDTYLTREDILEQLKDYPLVYSFSNLEISKLTLAKLEMTPLFRERFYIEDRSFKHGDSIYQLREYSKLEAGIEKFINILTSRVYALDDQRKSMLESMISNDRKLFKDKLKEEERRKLYEMALTKGLVVLSGKAGSGKTSSIVNLVNEYIDHSKTPIFVFTPTGRSNMVIRDRLDEQLDNMDENKVRVSTIHRFLYSALFDSLGSSNDGRNTYTNSYRDLRVKVWKMSKLISEFLEGDMSNLDELQLLTKDMKFRPKVVIIDESSMINERLLGALFMLLDPDGIEHLYLVGDEKQLPPIGPGRPFADIIAHLKISGNEENYLRLEANYRFSEDLLIGELSSLLEDDEDTENLISEILQKGDSSLEIAYFDSHNDLKKKIKKIANKIRQDTRAAGTLSDVFANVLENDDGTIDFNRLQILTPKRYGRFASSYINNSVMKNGVAKYEPRTKLICEENKYVDLNTDAGHTRILALANGSLGYITSEGEVYFKELEELEKIDDIYLRMQLNKIKRNASESTISSERFISLGYSITVHKSQGSDYDHVILVLSESTKFLTKELFYTAVTRIKTKLHILINGNLIPKLPEFIGKILENSEINGRKTLLFEQKEDLRRIYPVTLRDGTTIQTRSKIEKIIAKVLDSNNVDFVYEPRDLYLQYYILPDFKVNISGKSFYIEHLGLMDNKAYRKRWNKKLEKYKEMGLLDSLVTTTEGKESVNQDDAIMKIIEDMKNNSLTESVGAHSEHHYSI